MQGRKPYVMDVGPTEGVTLACDEPPPDGNADITGIELEGHYKPIPGGHMIKLNSTTLTITGDLFTNTALRLEDELYRVETTMFEYLPTLMGRLTTETAKKVLQKRLEEGK